MQLLLCTFHTDFTVTHTEIPVIRCNIFIYRVIGGFLVLILYLLLL